MTAPNMINTATVTGKTATANLSTSASNIIVNSSSSSTLVKLNHLILSNYGNATVTGSLFYYRYSTSLGYYLVSNLSVPNNSVLVVLGKDTPIYMEEGDVLQAFSNTANSMAVISSYEIIS